MPYIENNRRKALFCESLTDYDNTLNTPGELNYMLATNLNLYLEAHGESYSTYNDMIGALECLKLELYRRLAAKYEDKKIKLNGDVFNQKDFTAIQPNKKLRGKKK